MSRGEHYRVVCGELDIDLRVPYPADAEALALMALQRAIDREHPDSLSMILEVSGGQYTGDNTMYLSTPQLLAKLGRATGTEGLQ